MKRLEYLIKELNKAFQNFSLAIISYQTLVAETFSISPPFDAQLVANFACRKVKMGHLERKLLMKKSVEVLDISGTEIWTKPLTRDSYDFALKISNRILYGFNEIHNGAYRICGFRCRVLQSGEFGSASKELKNAF